MSESDSSNTAYLSKMFNLEYLDTSNISMSKALLYFYMALCIPFLSDLFSGQLQDFIKDSRAAKHIMGLVLLLNIIITIGGVHDTTQAIIYALVGYTWFIFTTKLDLRWNLIIVGLLVVGYLYETVMKNKEIVSETDQALYDEDKKKIQRKHYKMKTIIVLSIMLVTLIGSVEYFIKKKGEYGSTQSGGGTSSGAQFSYSKFLFAGRH